MKTFLHYIKNKYFLSLLFFVVWITFFDRYDLLSIWQLRGRLKQLREEKMYYLQEINNSQQIMNALKNDSVALEKFAREKYLMKRGNEDIFIIENP